MMWQQLNILLIRLYDPIDRAENLFLKMKNICMMINQIRNLITILKNLFNFYQILNIVIKIIIFSHSLKLQRYEIKKKETQIEDEYKIIENSKLAIKNFINEFIDTKQ